MKDFLGNGTFDVRVGSRNSDALEVLSGVPQGSMLEPFPSLFYINGLLNGLSPLDDMNIFRCREQN